MMLRIGARTIAAAGSVALVGVLTGPAMAAATISQATAQSLNLVIAGSPAVTQQVTATNDGMKQTKNDASTLPTLAGVLPGNSALGVGVAPQDAGANPTGTSYACAGIAGTGGGLIHTGNTSCNINGAPLTLGLGNLTLGSILLDPSSAVGGVVTQLGLDPVTSGLLTNAISPLTTAINGAVANTPLNIKLGGTVSAIEATCQANPTTASGTAHLVDTAGDGQPVPITATIGGKTVTIAQLPANPGPNTHVLTDLSSATQTVIDAVKVELNNAIGGALAGAGLGGMLQSVQDALVAQLVAQLQPVLKPLQANVLDITLNKQIHSYGGRKIDVTALDLQVLPAAARFAGASLVGGQLGHVTCGPNAAARTATPTPGTPTPGPGNTGGPGIPGAHLPNGVDAGLSGEDHRLQAAISGLGLGGALTLALFYRRFAAR